MTSPTIPDPTPGFIRETTGYTYETGILQVPGFQDDGSAALATIDPINALGAFFRECRYPGGVAVDQPGFFGNRQLIDMLLAYNWHIYNQLQGTGLNWSVGATHSGGNSGEWLVPPLS